MFKIRTIVLKIYTKQENYTNFYKANTKPHAKIFFMFQKGRTCLFSLLSVCYQWDLEILNL